MMVNNPTNVVAAFEMLLEEMEAEIDIVDRIGAKAFETHNYDRVREALARVGQFTALRDKVAGLRKDWDTLAAVEVAEEEEDEEARAARRNLGRLRRGLRTPEVTFYQPILRALVDLGGSARMGDVVAKVEQYMKGVLKDVDYQPLASDPDNPRWRNTAAWARQYMVNASLLKANSPHGYWEISEAGRRALADGTVGLKL